MKNLVYRIVLFPVTLVAGLMATRLSERYAASVDMWRFDDLDDDE